MRELDVCLLSVCIIGTHKDGGCVSSSFNCRTLRPNILIGAQSYCAGEVVWIQTMYSNDWALERRYQLSALFIN